MSQEGDHQEKEMPDFEKYRLDLVVFFGFDFGGLLILGLCLSILIERS